MISQGKQPRVLLIDDEDSYRTPVANYLRERGYVVDTASDAKQGLALLSYAQGQYDIIFVDQVLYGQDIDGIQLVRTIRESFPNIPVVVITGWGSHEKGIESLRSGAYRYVNKSAGIQELELLIEMAFEIKQQTGDDLRRPMTRQKVDAHRNRILAVFANPRGSDPLRLGTEDRVIRECLKISKHRDNMRLDVLHAATIHDVRRALLDKSYRIVQFSGHGTGRGLAFENEVGQIQLVPRDALAEFLSAYSPPIECVILNACYSVVQGQLIFLGIPYTIGMDGAISDEGATEFTRGFYDAVGAGKGIEFAYQEGCRTIKLMGFSDSSKPILFKRTN